MATVMSKYDTFFLCVCSLLSKPTALKDGTHHTAAVDQISSEKDPSPPPPNPPPPSATRIPDAELVPQLCRVTGSASVLDRGSQVSRAGGLVGG